MAIVLAAFAPTFRIPKPNSKRSTELFFDKLIAFNRLFAAVSPNLSKLIKSSYCNRYKSVTLVINPCASNCEIILGPSPSIFIAFREAKWVNDSCTCAGQAGLMHLNATSPSTCTSD